jgi:HK97 family phage major capsid protein
MLKAKMVEQEALVNKAIAENRAMSTEEQASYDALEIEIKNLEKSIEAQAKIEARALENKNAVNEPLYAQPKGQSSVTDITREIFGSVGGYFQAVHKSKNESEYGEKLAKLNSEVIKISNAAGMNETTPADGGVLVGTDVSTVLLAKAYETGKLVSKAFKLPLSQGSNAISLPVLDETSRVNGSRYGGIQMYWQGEAAQITGTKPKLGTVDMKLKDLNGLVYVTNDLLDDASALESWIMKKFPEEAGFKLDDAIINGTGAGMPLGVSKSGALIVVAKEVGQLANTILAENIIKMYSCFNGNPATSVWVINRDTLPQVVTMSIAIGTGGVLVYMPPTGLAGNIYGTLFGIPVIPIEQCETLGTVGDIQLIDMGQYIMADKGSLKIASSMHVRFEYNEMAFRFTYRADGKPEKSKPLTPFKGTNTVSPYIALATRG